MLSVTPLAIPGALLIEAECFYDHRGGNYELFNTEVAKICERRGSTLSTDSISFSRKNTLRGLHGDNHTTKLITCLYGDIWFSAVSVDDPKQQFSLALSGKRPASVLLPPNIVNGHLCLSDECVFGYKLSHPYTPQDQQYSYHYKSWNLYWPICETQIITSQRDKNATLRQFPILLKQFTTL